MEFFKPLIVLAHGNVLIKPGWVFSLLGWKHTTEACQSICIIPLDPSSIYAMQLLTF